MNPTRRRSVLGPLARRREEAKTSSESGFTLIELLVTMVILPFIVGALSLAIIAVFSLNGTTGNSVNDAADAQVLSTTYENDVHSAIEVTTMSTPACGSSSQTQLLGFEWGPNQNNGYNSVVSYVVVPTSNSKVDQFVRQFCANVATTPTITSIVSADISPNAEQAKLDPTKNPAVVVPVSSAVNPGCGGLTAATEFVVATCVSQVTFAAIEPLSAFSYNLVAVPAQSASSGQTSTLASSSGCGFASPPLETQNPKPLYVSQLCFVDFAALQPAVFSSTTPSGPANADGTDYCASGGQYMSVSVQRTPFSLIFCLLVKNVSPTQLSYPSLQDNSNSGPCVQYSGPPNPDPYGAVCSAYIPTYYTAGGSEAFLGNNGFYLGIPGSPAIYQTQDKSLTNLFFYNIEVLGANGHPASGWELSTGDAESTDHNESILWTTSSCITPGVSTFPTGYQTCNASTSPPLRLLADFPGGTQSAEIGNACTYTTSAVPGTAYTGTWLTGVGTSTVECAEDTDSNKTGAVMLGAVQPSSLTVQMQAGGLEAVFLGLLLND